MTEQEEPEIKIIENSEKAKDKNGRGFGDHTTVLTNKEMTALRKGQCLALAINGGEYIEFITLRQ